MQTESATIKDPPASDDQQHLKSAAGRLYTNPQAQSISDEQITELLPLVNAIARRVVTYIKPPWTFDDLISAGMVGLVKAGRNYNPSHNAEFKTYANIRIRGAILDEVKSWSFVSDNLRKKIRDAMVTSQEMMQDTGSTPNDKELAKKMGISLDELHKTMESARAQQFASLDASSTDEAPSLSALLTSANALPPDKQLEKQELVEKLAKAIQELDKKQCQLIILYYQQNLTMKQIAEVFEITESRVSQIHASAIFNLSTKLSQWQDD